jgi:hypothetical protein
MCVYVYECKMQSLKPESIVFSLLFLNEDGDNCDASVCARSQYIYSNKTCFFSSQFY